MSGSGRPLEISIDSDACRGAGQCAFRAPGTFALGEDGRAHLRSGDGDPEAVVLAAARSCPHFAIAVRRADETLV